MESLSVGLVIETKQIWEETQSCLRGFPVRVVLEQAGLGDLREFLVKLDRARPDVLLLDISRLDSPQEAIRQIRASPGAPVLIAMNTGAEPEAILGAVRAGAREYLYPPLQTALVEALERFAADRAREHDLGSRTGKTAAFLSAKGGCGATTIACHVALELHHHVQAPVLLADFDIDTGVVGFLMKTKSPYSVLDAASNLHRLDLSFWNALISNGRPGLEVLSAPAAPGPREALKPEQLHHILRFARTHYRFTLVDLGRSLSADTWGALEDIDELFLVTTLDVPALHRAKQVVQALLVGGYGQKRLRLVLNRVPKRPDVALSELESVLGLPIYATLPNDYPALYESYAEGKLLPQNCHLGKQIARLAAKMSGVPETRRRFTLLG